MKNTKRHIYINLIFLIIAIFFTASIYAAPKSIIRSGDRFPEIVLPAPQNTSDAAYLGVTKGQGFTPSQIDAEVLLIEFFNVHCPHCIEQAPSYNKLYRHIQKHLNTKDHIKMISIAVGNLAAEVETFKAEHQIPYPVFADSNFNIWRAIGGKVSPFSVFIRQNHFNSDSYSAGVVCATHSGTNHRYRKIYSQLEDLLVMTEEELTAFVDNKIADRPAEPAPDSEEALADHCYHALRQLGRVTSFTKIDLAQFNSVYKARVHKNRKSTVLYAKLVNRPTACDVCHGIKLIYIFNSAGEIIDIAPISLSKSGNGSWDLDDIKKLKQRLIGRNLKDPKPFQPDVDAITSATISTSIIFDSISQGQLLLEALEQHNHLK